MKLTLKQIDLKFVEQGHKHLLEGIEVPGCTTISGLFDGNEWRAPWGAKMVVLKMLLLMREHHDGKWFLGKDIRAWLKIAKKQWRSVLNTATDLGTLLHRRLEIYLKERIDSEDTLFEPKPTEIPDIFKQQVEDFLAWESACKVEWIASEFQVGSLTHKYAGIGDCLFCINGRLVLGDIKTSKDFHANWRIQLIGLKIALEEMGCPPIDEIAVLHFPKNGVFKYIPIPIDFETEKKAFLVAKEFYSVLKLFKERTKTDNHWKKAA